MWQKFFKFGRYFYDVIMPVRFRRAAVESRFTRYLDRGADRWQHPDQIAEMAADDAAREAARKAKSRDAADQARQEGQAETGQATLEAPPPSGRSRFLNVLRWVLHILLVLLVLVVLYFLNRWLGMERLLRSDWPVLHPYWLPLLFLILYALFWLGGWLWSLTGPDHVGDEYPDLNQAWDLAVQALYRSGIDIRQAPVFLVLGRTEAAPQELFSATLRLRVSAPQGGVSPIRVYASQDRVFVTCPGASALARQARTLVQRAYDDEFGDEGDETGSGKAVESAAAVGQLTPAATPPANGSAPSSSDATAPAPEASATATAVAEEPGAATEEELRVLNLLQAEGLGTGTRSKKMAASFLKDPVQVRLLTSRLQHLCRLIRRDRQPYCPINGILVLVPAAALEDDVDASQTATACRYDMQVVHQTLQVQCPAFAMVCDLERSEGFRQFLLRLPARHNISRLGQRFPLYPDVDEREIPRLIETGTAWLANALLPSIVYNLFRVDTPGAAARGATAAVDENIKLYDFVWEMREERKRLARFLTRGLLMDVPRAYYFGGVYLAGTGQGLTAFTPGVFLRLLQSQNFLAWTPEALSADRRYRSWAWFFFITNLILLIAGPLLVYFFWPR